ncbi:GT99 family glycosyltransferase N-terminal domain-containing protein [Ramlibacter sp. MMS24-I3-19]|uniref:GT99 family glycosyltransferase N-terminal domain-containing protein n=1 Tax=Ramlibacter sp. MMS24-I3-19 TaxID=3416606 RepID=UPI003CFF2A45
MLCVFLPALNFRGNHSPHLWWFYKFVSAFGRDAWYVCGDEYFADPALHLAHGRHEATSTSAQRLEYDVPGLQLLSQLPRHDVPPGVWRSIEDRFRSNPLRAYQYYCLEPDEQLACALSASLDHMQSRTGPPEAVITCVNCATLSAVCKQRGLPLIHMELGPLRPPNFLPTVYFDFSGVNGQTEAQARFEAAEVSTQERDWHCADALRSLFTTLREPPDNEDPDTDLGIALQIEDDSNIVCYSNGFSSAALINQALITAANKEAEPPVLVRTHPGSLFRLRDLVPSVAVDSSRSAIDFILRCRRIHTINSSVAVEAMLLGREVAVFGDSPFGFCIDADTFRPKQAEFAFLLLNYLVPWDIAFSAEYVRWRIAAPPETSIREIHLEHFMQLKIKELETRLREVEAQTTYLKAQVELLSSSLSWRLARAVRSFYTAVATRHARPK